MELRRVSNPGGTPAISGNVDISIQANGPTIGVPSIGATGNLDGLDYRLLSAHFRNGQLWTTENMGVDNNGTRNTTATRDGVRWYVLTGIPTGQTPTVSQWGTVFDSTAAQRSYWMGTVMVSGQGHAAMGFSAAGPNDHANAATVGRLVNDAAGTMRTPVLYTASSSPYNPLDSTGAFIDRWGDYSYTSLDPSDDMTMWTIQEFCNAPNSYGVQVVKLLAPGPAMPTNCSPASVAAGAANVNVVVTGMSDGTTGFFDPGNGFSNRIAAVVNGGGVTLNSITYSNPTHVTLNLSVSGSAAGGARTLTVTNPDGQSATSATGILTIIINPATGVFSWTPNEAEGPEVTNITVRVTDSGSPALSDAKTFTVTVNEVNSAPVLSPIANRTIHQGTTLVVTNSATDSDLPANTLTFSLVSPPAGATIGSASGILTWTPDATYVNTSSNITVRVTDNGIPNLSDSKSFLVNIVPRPLIQSIVVSNNIVTLTWSSIAGQTYRVRYASDLGSASWNDLLPDVQASGATASKTDSSAPLDQRFYRVEVVQ